MSAAAPLTRRTALGLALPLMAANAVVPLAGLVDTLVIGLAGTKDDLAGVALGSAVLNILVASVYFLRMSTTALTAQAVGREDLSEVHSVLIRAGVLGAALGFGFFVLQHPIAALSFAVLQGEAAAETQGEVYFTTRLWGAPAAFAALALTGWLIGRRKPGLVLLVTSVHSGVNIVLDVLLVLVWDGGVRGLALATAGADWSQALVAFIMVRALSKRDGVDAQALSWARVFEAQGLRRLFGVNRDLFIRTLCLIAIFTWFVNAMAQHGAAALAGTYVLLQFVTVWACVLDAYAFIAESVVGEAVGARSRARFRRAVRLTSELSLATGAVLMALALLFGDEIVSLVIADPEARASALIYLTYCAVIPFLGAPAWQLDGIFIGAARGPAMRNAMIGSLALYVVSDWILGAALGAHGAWAAFVLSYVWRAGTLGVAYGRVERAVETAP